MCSLLLYNVLLMNSKVKSVFKFHDYMKITIDKQILHYGAEH